ncbi:MAG: 1-deoxy-D-xylulose-5-phosphate synthase [Bacteroidales bacterium]|nr:1-deoxy-D-xylulose-5-phosphate synthase [Bacteroidales bacterium]
MTEKLDTQFPLVASIHSPADVKRLTLPELNTLAEEIRQLMLLKESKQGGHFGPNFGMVEAIIALHYVFNSPDDRLIFDVSHQTYPHKILTGRAYAWLDPARYNDVTGYSAPSESVHDHFVIGHTSTSVSLASGMAKARDAMGGHENVIAIIGDGSLSGGEAFEGLDFVGEMDSNFIAVINDNQMSIAENHGGLYKSLAQLRATNGNSPDNYFRALGLDYIYVADGNDIASLIDAFQRVKDSTHPVAVHINTLKGKGYQPAVEHKEEWHYTTPFDIPTGHMLNESPYENWQDLTATYLLRRMKEDPTVLTITAGTPAALGFSEDLRHEAGRQFIDVGIAEEHAVAMASGMARRGAKPVFGVFSTFVQRTYDQLQQDLCINASPATIITVWGSPFTMNDVTHACLYDIALLGNIPGLVYLAPTSWEEYEAMLSWSIDQKDHPVAVRMPVGKVLHDPNFTPDDYSRLNRYKVVHRGSKIAIIGLGNMLATALETAQLLKEHGIDASVINPRYITGLDTELLDDLKRDHHTVVTLEDGILNGGFGEKIARYYGPTDVHVRCYGLRKEFRDRFDPSALLSEAHLTPPLILNDLLH